MGLESGQCHCCQVCKDCTQFQKLLDLKDKGVVIYRHSARVQDDTNTDLTETTTNTTDDVFIIHNIKNEDITPADMVPTMVQRKIDCPRCQQIVEHVQRLIQSVSVFNKNDIIGICDHCRTKDQRRCSRRANCECKKIAKKFADSRIQKSDSHENKVHLKIWLKKIQNLLRNIMIDGIQKKGKTRNLSQLQLEQLRQRSVHKPGVEELFNHRRQDAGLPSNVDSLPVSEIGYLSDQDEVFRSLQDICKSSKVPPIQSLRIHDNKKGQASEEINLKQSKDYLEICSLEEKIRPSLLKSLTSSRKIRKPSLKRIRKYYSDDTLLTTLSGVTDDGVDQKVFKFYFPQDIKKKTITHKGHLSSDELIKDTQEKLQLINEEKAKKKQRQMEEQRIRRLEAIERKLIAREGRLEKTKCYLKPEEGKRKITNLRAKPEKIIQRFSKKGNEKGDVDKNQKDEVNIKKFKEKDENEKYKVQDKDKKKDKNEMGKKDQEQDKEVKQYKDHSMKEKTEKPKAKKHLQYSKEKDADEVEKEQLPIQYPKAKEKTEKYDELPKERGKVEKENEDQPTKDSSENEENEVQVPTKERSEKDKLTKIKEDQLSGKDKNVKGKKSGERKDIEYLDKVLTQQEKAKQEVQGKEKDTNEKNTKKESVMPKTKEAAVIKGKDKTGGKGKVDFEKIKGQDAPAPKELDINQVQLMKRSDDLISSLMKPKAGDGRYEKPQLKISLTELYGLPEVPEKPQEMQSDEDEFTNSESELDRESLLRKKNKPEDKSALIIGTKVYRHKGGKACSKIIKEPHKPTLFNTAFEVPKLDKMDILKFGEADTFNTPLSPQPQTGKTMRVADQELPKGVIRYMLSDRTFIDKGWTLLPTEKVVRKMNVYRMRPAHPEFDWFKHNKNKRLMQYDSGERLAEFDDNGRGRWYYRNGRIALDYYDAEELNAQQRFVIYSSGEFDERGRSHPITVLATFDYLGNGVVFDHSDLSITRLKVSCLIGE